jgi:hypothetical protein
VRAARRAAPPGVLEARLGLLGLERDDHDSRYTSPLLRVRASLPVPLVRGAPAGFDRSIVNYFIVVASDTAVPLRAEDPTS